MVINPNRPTLSIRRPTEMNAAAHGTIVVGNPNQRMIRGPIS